MPRTGPDLPRFAGTRRNASKSRNLRVAAQFAQNGTLSCLGWERSVNGPERPEAHEGLGVRPDVVTGEGDVFPAEGCDMRQEVIRYGDALGPQMLDGTIQIDRVPVGKVEDRRGGCSLPVGLSASLSPAPAVRADMAPSPVPARQTGRADFPHPAFSRSIRPSLSAGRRVAAGRGRGRVPHRGTRPGSGGTRCLVVPCGASTSAGPGGQCSLG